MAKEKPVKAVKRKSAKAKAVKRAKAIVKGKAKRRVAKVKAGSAVRASKVKKAKKKVKLVNPELEKSYKESQKALQEDMQDDGGYETVEAQTDDQADEKSGVEFIPDPEAFPEDEDQEYHDHVDDIDPDEGLF